MRKRGEKEALVTGTALKGYRGLGAQWWKRCVTRPWVSSSAPEREEGENKGKKYCRPHRQMKENCTLQLVKRKLPSITCYLHHLLPSITCYPPSPGYDCQVMEEEGSQAPLRQALLPCGSRGRGHGLCMINAPSQLWVADPGQKGLPR